MNIFNAELLNHMKVIKDGDKLHFELNTKTMNGIIETICEGKIFAIPFFSDAYCKYLCKKFDSWDNIKMTNANNNVYLPNGLSNDGFIPQQFDYEIDKHILNIFQLLIDYFFKYKQQQKYILSQYSYMIRYKTGFDEMLKCHCDDSDVTINVCINSKDIKFKGSNLYFYPMYNKANTPPPPNTIHEQKLDDNNMNLLKFIQYKHKCGYAIIHLGNIFHGVTKLEHGSRYNLIHWVMIDNKLQNQWKNQFYKEYMNELELETK
eukprot:297190_1